MTEGKTPTQQNPPDEFAVTEMVGRRFQRGEAATVQEVHTRVRRIIGFRGYGIPREERRDLEQEVIAQLWQGAQEQRLESSSNFWGLVETVAARRVIDWLRARRETAPLDSLAVEEPGPLGQTLNKERAGMAHAVLQRLPEPCRRLIHLRLVEGRTYSQIARILHKREGALRVQMHRCIGSARAAVAELRGSERERVETR